MEQFDSLNVSQFELDLGSGQLKYKLKGEDKVYIVMNKPKGYVTSACLGNR